MQAELISSKNNPKIKNFALLQKSSERFQQQLIIIEGIKEVEKAVKKGYAVDSVYFCGENIRFEEVLKVVPHQPHIKYYDTTPEVYAKIAYREGSKSLIALAKPRKHPLHQLKLSSKPLVLVIEGVEKPGNLGAIYRTADAAAVDAIIICDPRTDLYNPNAIRASLGCVFTIPTALCTSAEAIEFLKEHQVAIFATYLKASVPYHTVNLNQSVAIVMGTEATGISDAWVEAAQANIIIPMRGEADSLNVSVSTAIMVFEALRQREN